MHDYITLHAPPLQHLIIGLSPENFPISLLLVLFINRGIYLGGEDFRAFVIGPNGNTIPLDVKDNNNGTYTIMHTPHGPGEHI